MGETRILLVDDDEIVRLALSGVLVQAGFRVTTAANVTEALKRISGPETYDVLLSDLHMPGAGDGLTVVSAMRHANPKAVTLLLSAFPEMNAAAQAILRQTDEILVKPMDLTRWSRSSTSALPAAHKISARLRRWPRFWNAPLRAPFKSGSTVLKWNQR